MSMSSASASATVDQLVEASAGCLRRERGVSELTVAVTCRMFAIVDRGGSDSSDFAAAEVANAVLAQVVGWSPASGRRFGRSLGAFLRYCFVV